MRLGLTSSQRSTNVLLMTYHGTHPDTLVCAACLDRPMTQHEIMNLDEWADAQRAPKICNTCEERSYGDDIIRGDRLIAPTQACYEQGHRISPNLSGSCDEFDAPALRAYSTPHKLSVVRDLQGFRFWRTRTPVARWYRAHRETLRDLYRVGLATVVTVALLVGLIIYPSALVIASLSTPTAQYAGLVLAVVATSAACIPAIKLMGKLA